MRGLLFSLGPANTGGLGQGPDAAGVDFTLLGGEEWCCGFPLLGAGALSRARGLIEHNLEAVRAKGARRVMFACPSCYMMWREFYPLNSTFPYH